MNRIILIFVCLLPALTLSANMNFLNNSDSAVRFFSDTDWELFNNAVENALNKSANGSKVSWKNQKSGNYGFVMPLTKTTKNGTLCRNLKIVSTANNRNDDYTFTFCKYPSGWKIPSDGN